MIFTTRIILILFVAIFFLASENVMDAGQQGFRNIVEALQNDVTKISTHFFTSKYFTRVW